MASGPEQQVEPEALQLVLDRILHLGKAHLDGAGIASNSISMSAALTSTLVTGP
jgi:hypothetical protein